MSEHPPPLSEVIRALTPRAWIALITASLALVGLSLALLVWT